MRCQLELPSPSEMPARCQTRELGKHHRRSLSRGPRTAHARRHYRESHNRAAASDRVPVLQSLCKWSGLRNRHMYTDAGASITLQLGHECSTLEGRGPRPDGPRTARHRTAQSQCAREHPQPSRHRRAGHWVALEIANTVPTPRAHSCPKGAHGAASSMGPTEQRKLACRPIVHAHATQLVSAA